jgi:hypothetical protein
VRSTAIAPACGAAELGYQLDLAASAALLFFHATMIPEDRSQSVDNVPVRRVAARDAPRATLDDHRLATRWAVAV